jgi:UDPglucose--hexose-1-phosphate uridylyltransferase
LAEVRVDALTGLRTIVAGERATRPGGAPRATPPEPIDSETDPFAAGHEDRTPPELAAVRPSGGPPDSAGWTVRVVPNLYPALAPAPDSPGERDAHPELFYSEPARGAHEVVVNAPDPVTSLADLEPEQVERAMAMWRARMRAHADSPYVHLIVNERREAGASLPHTHAQLYALSFVPAAVARERERFGAHAVRTMGGNLLEDLVQEEVRRRQRLVAVDDEAVLIAPYASRLPYQLMLAPRVPQGDFAADGPLGASLLHAGLRRLRTVLGASPPLNLWVRTAPEGAETFSWRIDVLPRLTHLAGLELGTGVNLNVVAPEQAAAELRAAG